MKLVMDGNRIDVNRFVVHIGERSKRDGLTCAAALRYIARWGSLRIDMGCPMQTGTCALFTLLTCTPPPQITWRLRARIYCVKKKKNSPASLVWLQAQF